MRNCGKLCRIPRFLIKSRQEEWQNVQRSLTLATRLNEHLIAGNIQGQRVLTIKTGGTSTTMQFTLYVVPQEKKG